MVLGIAVLVHGGGGSVERGGAGMGVLVHVEGLGGGRGVALGGGGRGWGSVGSC